MPTRVRGVVLSGDGRSPATGVTVQAFDPGTGFFQGTAVTDANGNFILSGLEDRTWIARLSSIIGGTYSIQQVKESWVEDEPHAQRTTLSAHGHGQLRDITPNDHHNQGHVLADSSALGLDHTVSGLTTGHVLTALSATTAAFQAPAAGGSSDPLDLIERTVSSPPQNTARVYARVDPDNPTYIQIVAVSSTGEECVMCTLNDLAHTNTLTLNLIE